METDWRYPQSNILVDNDGNARLSNIGVSKINLLEEWYHVHGVGCARWTAPELSDPQEEREKEPLYTSHCDVYSFDMNVLEVSILSKSKH